MRDRTLLAAALLGTARLMTTALETPLLAMALVAAAFFPAPGRAADTASRTAHCESGAYRYVLFTPKSASSMPAIVLLHGAGDIPEPMVDAWRKLANREHIVLIAPELPRDPNFEEMAPKVFRCVVEDAKRFAALDAQRIYLFGHSMGGYLAYDGATLESQYFAGAAIHGMRIADDYAWIVKRAERKTPIAIYIGDHDQFVPLAGARKTRDLLQNAGFPIHYQELKNHDHNYYALSGQINADAWNFLKDKHLPSGE